MLAIPFSDWTTSGTDPWGTFRSELRVFDIDTTTGFKLRGSVSMKDVYMLSLIHISGRKRAVCGSPLLRICGGGATRRVASEEMCIRDRF